MKAHRLKLGQRVSLDTPTIKGEATVTRLAFEQDTAWPCPDCGLDCPGPWYALASTHPEVYRTDVYPEHQLTPNQGDPQ